LQEPKKKRTYKLVTPQSTLKSHVWATETHEPIATKVCVSGTVQSTT